MTRWRHCEDAPEAPHVDLAPVRKRLPRLRRHEPWRPDKRPGAELEVGRRREPEIAYFHVLERGRRQKEVLRFEVAVNDAGAVAVRQPARDFRHERRGSAFAERPCVAHACKQLAAPHELHDYQHVRRILEISVAPHHVGVLQEGGE